MWTSIKKNIVHTKPHSFADCYYSLCNFMAVEIWEKYFETPEISCFKNLKYFQIKGFARVLNEGYKDPHFAALETTVLSSTIHANSLPLIVENAGNLFQHCAITCFPRENSILWIVLYHIQHTLITHSSRSDCILWLGLLMQQICASVDFKIISGCNRHFFCIWLWYSHSVVSDPLWPHG